jgi:hypothetical protein
MDLEFECDPRLNKAADTLFEIIKNAHRNGTKMTQTMTHCFESFRREDSPRFLRDFYFSLYSRHLLDLKKMGYS